MLLTIIIPVFNEEKTIKELLIRVNNVQLPKNIKKEIIVVDDYSSDKTSTILKKIKKTKFNYIRNKKNLGKGASVRIGLTYARGQLIIIQDADLEYDPKEYIKLLQPIFKKKAQVVYGTRLINYPLRFWGKNKTVMPFHLMANRFLTRLTNLLYGSNLTDMESCYKLFRRKILDNIEIRSNRFDFEPEITAKFLKLGIPIVEVPIIVKPRSYQEGKKINWQDGLIAIWTLIKYRFVD